MGVWQLYIHFQIDGEHLQQRKGCCGLPARETCNIHPGHHPFNQSGVGDDRGGGARVLFSFFFLFLPRPTISLSFFLSFSPTQHLLFPFFLKLFFFFFFFQMRTFYLSCVPPFSFYSLPSLNPNDIVIT